MENFRREQTQKLEKRTRKITLPTFEKRGIQEAKLPLRRFTQYIKLAQNINLNEMTTDSELSPNYRDDLGHQINYILLFVSKHRRLVKHVKHDETNGHGQTKSFEYLKENITKKPCLGHYIARNENIITTDAGTK